MSEELFDIKNWISANKRCTRWIGIPHEWYNYFVHDDFDWLVDRFKEYVAATETYYDGVDPNKWRRIREVSARRLNFKNVLRSRRNATFISGMYTVRTAEPWFVPVSGKYNTLIWNVNNTNDLYSCRPKKGDLLMWIETDILKRHIFMFNNAMWTCSNKNLDGVSKI